MRKLFSWYNILQSTDSLKEKEENKEGEDKEKAAAIKLQEEKNAGKKSVAKDTSKAKTSAGVKKTAGVRKTGSA
jgi:hypothetical protein